MLVLRGARGSGADLAQPHRAARRGRNPRVSPHRHRNQRARRSRPDPLHPRRRPDARSAPHSRPGRDGGRRARRRRDAGALRRGGAAGRGRRRPGDLEDRPRPAGRRPRIASRRPQPRRRAHPRAAAAEPATIMFAGARTPPDPRSKPHPQPSPACRGGSGPAKALPCMGGGRPAAQPWEGGGWQASAEAAHTHGIAAYTIVLEGPVSRLDFARALGGLAMDRGNDLLRVKGIVRFADRPETPPSSRPRSTRCSRPNGSPTGPIPTIAAGWSLSSTTSRPRKSSTASPSPRRFF